MKHKFIYLLTISLFSLHTSCIFAGHSHQQMTSCPIHGTSCIVPGFYCLSINTNIQSMHPALLPSPSRSVDPQDIIAVTILLNQLTGKNTKTQSYEDELNEANQKAMQMGLQDARNNNPECNKELFLEKIYDFLMHKHKYHQQTQGIINEMNLLLYTQDPSSKTTVDDVLYKAYRKTYDSALISPTEILEQRSFPAISNPIAEPQNSSRKTSVITSILELALFTPPIIDGGRSEPQNSSKETSTKVPNPRPSHSSSTSIMVIQPPISLLPALLPLPTIDGGRSEPQNSSKENSTLAAQFFLHPSLPPITGARAKEVQILLENLKRRGIISQED